MCVWVVLDDRKRYIALLVVREHLERARVHPGVRHQRDLRPRREHGRPGPNILGKPGSCPGG